MDYDKTTGAPVECAGSDEGCNNPSLYDLGLDGTSREPTAVIGGPFPLIGIGTMCALFLVIVLVSAFVIRRKIFRRQMELSHSQRYNARNRFFITPNRTTLAAERGRHQVWAFPRNKLPPHSAADSLQSPTLRIPRASAHVCSSTAASAPIELKTLTVNANDLTEVPSTAICSTQAFLPAAAAATAAAAAAEIRTFDQQEVLYLENCLDVGSFLFIQPHSTDPPQWRLESPHHAFSSSSSAVTTTVCTSNKE